MENLRQRITQLELRLQHKEKIAKPTLLFIKVAKAALNANSQCNEAFESSVKKKKINYLTFKFKKDG